MKSVTDFLRLAGMKYWSASLLPALAGTTLPFWLHPPGFQFQLGAALSFLMATLLGHMGFSFLYARFSSMVETKWSHTSLVLCGVCSLTLAVLLGWDLQNSLTLHAGVPQGIFLVYGGAILFTGLLYVAPPFVFYQRLFGDMILSVGLGMLPVLGAYLVQVGDLTRTVYLASLPLVIATGLWVWITELMHTPEVERLGYTSTVQRFSKRFARRYIPLVLLAGLYGSLLVAVWGRPALHPSALFALLSGGLAGCLIRVIWRASIQNIRWSTAKMYACLIYHIVGLAVIGSSLVPVLTE